LFYAYGKATYARFGKGQYRALRIALGLMGSTPKNCMGVLSGMPPLAERFAYLNFRYLVAAFYRLGHPLRERLRVLGLGTLNMGRCIKGYSDVFSLNIVPSESFTRHELPALFGTPLVDENMGEETCQFSGGDVFIGCAPRDIDCDVRVWCVVHFLFGWFFEGFLRVLRALLFIKWVWVDLDIGS
jgi:hypothetical protein